MTFSNLKKNNNSSLPKAGNALDMLFVLCLFALFAASVLMVLMLGARSYKASVVNGQDGRGARECILYVNAKVNHSDSADAISVGEFDGQNALILREEMNGGHYVTYVYAYEGELRELFCEEGSGLTAKDGIGLMNVSDFSVEQVEDGLLKVSCTDGGDVQLSQYLLIQSKGGD